MSISKRQLYAAGEPLGEAVTRRKPGGGYVCGGGGGGSSSSSSTTQNFDKRLAVGDGGAGITGDNSSIAINVLDGGIVSRAMDTVDLSNAIGREGFTKLLDTASLMFNKSESLIGQTQKSVADAYSQAQTDKAGAIDQKTIIVLAVAGAVAMFALRK